MMRTSWLGAERRALERCESTNDVAHELARAGAAHGAIVTARSQSAGRGRGDHRWHSPDQDNLYLSCILRPSGEPAGAPPITLAAGVGVYDAVVAYGVRPSLKWPNDVLVHGRKLAGILTEMSTYDAKVDFVVLGIGVNLNNAEFPPELDGIATSLRLALGDRRIDPEVFLNRLLCSLECWLDRFFCGGLPRIAAPWTERAFLTGRRVATAMGEGMATGLDDDGALLIQTATGVRRVVSGDVTLLP
jgi:BirA family transcriptional regulator, biotin operon repressor / biotin---[acetyl-CoA-carboxylase] ligase